MSTIAGPDRKGEVSGSVKARIDPQPISTNKNVPINSAQTARHIFKPSVISESPIILSAPVKYKI